MWGARLDQPRPPCVLPGAEDGYFGAPAIDPVRGLKLQLQDVTSSPASILLRLSTADAPQVFLGIEYRLSPHGVLSVRSSLRGSATPGWLAAMALPLPSHMEELITFGGDWAREFAMHRQVIGTAANVLQSRRGRPGHDRFPGLFVGERGLGDDHGDVVGVTLGWSGSHRLSVERLREGQLIVQAGELFTDGDSVPSTYESPWCHAVHSARGLNGAMQALHAFLRDGVIPANVSSKPRPVHYNTWEAIYFKHDLATLKDLANRAAQVGAERFVLDDGWFKGRNDDRAGLGDLYDRYITAVVTLAFSVGARLNPALISKQRDHLETCCAALVEGVFNAGLGTPITHARLERQTQSLLRVYLAAGRTANPVRDQWFNADAAK